MWLDWNRCAIREGAEIKFRVRNRDSYTSRGASPTLDQGKPCPCKIGVRALFGNQQHQPAAAEAVHNTLSANGVL